MTNNNACGIECTVLQGTKMTFKTGWLWVMLFGLVVNTTSILLLVYQFQKHQAYLSTHAHEINQLIHAVEAIDKKINK